MTKRKTSKTPKTLAAKAKEAIFSAVLREAIEPTLSINGEKIESSELTSAISRGDYQCISEAPKEDQKVVRKFLDMTSKIPEEELAEAYGFERSELLGGKKDDVFVKAFALELTAWAYAKIVERTTGENKTDPDSALKQVIQAFEKAVKRLSV